jgi:hypothetical protein
MLRESSNKSAPRRRSARPAIGLLTHGAGDPNSQTVWEGVQSAAREHGANVVCFPGKPLCSSHGYEAQSNIIYDLVGRGPVIEYTTRTRKEALPANCEVYGNEV